MVVQFWLYYKYYQTDIKSKDFGAKDRPGYVYALKNQLFTQ
ncbi:hypothetical protein AOT82_1728 [Psychrobacter sp. AntiMn-1]|nr:hypothetical protein AOT82_1728 [Psychrobacter sp. AntiMn-1]